jgi:hypothetical protein
VGLGSPLSVRSRGRRTDGPATRESHHSAVDVHMDGPASLGSRRRRSGDEEDEAFPLQASRDGSVPHVIDDGSDDTDGEEHVEESGDGRNRFADLPVSMEDVSKEDILFVRSAVIKSSSGIRSVDRTTGEYSAPPSGHHRRSRGHVEEDSEDAGKYGGEDSSCRISSRATKVDSNVVFLKSFLVDMERDFVDEYGRMEYEYIMRK